MVVDLRSFGESIWLLIGLLLLAGFGLVVLVAVWTGLKYVVWRRAQHQAEAEHRAARFRSDGTRKPATAAGVCGECGRSYRQVYCLPDGRRLCAGHYAALAAE